MGATDELVAQWREVGPVAWAEGAYGWLGVDSQPVTLLGWQRAILSAWEAHRGDCTTLAMSNIKKTGKTLANAVLLCWRWLALPGEHFVCGNDFDQSAARQFGEIAGMVKRNRYLRRNVRATARQLEFIPTGSTVTALAVDAAGNAGANHLSVSHTESWGIIYEAGIRAYEELTPPPGRFYGLPCLRICDSYSGYEGESETWHKLVDRGLAGERVSDDWPIFRAGGLLLFHMAGAEAQARCFRGSAADRETYYTEQREQLREGAFLRLHENARSSGSEQFISLASWDACTDPDHRPLMPGADDRLYVGVDASTKGDSSAVVAVTYDREGGKVQLARHRIWQPSKRDPLDIDSTIGAELRELRAGFDLGAVLVDPYQLHDLSTRLRADGLPMTEYAQSTPNLTSMSQNLFDLIRFGNLLAYPDAQLRRHVSHAVAVESARGWKISKHKTSHKIDAVIALAMACLEAVRDSRNTFEVLFAV